MQSVVGQGFQTLAQERQYQGGSWGIRGDPAQKAWDGPCMQAAYGISQHNDFDNVIEGYAKIVLTLDSEKRKQHKHKEPAPKKTILRISQGTRKWCPELGYYWVCLCFPPLLVVLFP